MQKPATQRTEAWTNIFATLLRCLTSQELFGGSSIGEFSLHKWLKKGETLLPRSEKRMKRHGTGTGHWGQVVHINFKFDHAQPSSKKSLDLSLMPSRNLSLSLSLCIALYLSVYQANYIPSITYVSPPGTPQPLEQAGSSHSSICIYICPLKTCTFHHVSGFQTRSLVDLTSGRPQDNNSRAWDNGKCQALVQ